MWEPFLLKMCDHKNVLKLHHFWFEKSEITDTNTNYLWLQTEKCHENLHDYIIRKNKWVEA